MKKVLVTLFISLAFFACKKQEPTAYLFSYFSGEGDGLHLAYSYDGLKWNAVSDSIYIVPEVAEDKLMRDPSVTCGPDGTYHLVWTTSWHNRCIGYASTKDFIHWSAQKRIDVMADYPSARNTWAPEITYNADDSMFYIYWASTLPEHTFVQTSEAEKGLNHRLYYTKTKDFETFAPTKMFFNPDFSVIDAALLRSKKENDWIMFLKNENSAPAEKNIRYIRAKDLNIGFPGEVSAPISGKDWSEGPSPLYVGDTIYVYYDKYNVGKYGASRSVDDGKTWEDVSDQVTFPKGIRHGTAIKVPESLLKNLLGK